MTTTTPQIKAPVTVTRGLEPKILSQSIHWIEGTFKGRETLNMPLILSQTYVESKPQHGYTEGSRFSDGRKVWTNINRPEMGTHWVWDGQSCDDCPKDPVALIKMLHCFGFSFTRIDMAIDVFNFNLSPRRATKEIELGNIKTLAKEFPIGSDAKHPGYTQYVGKFTSEIYLKLYDKAVQMGVSGDHTRVELTVKGKRANKAAWEIVRGTDFRRMVVSFADFTKWREWSEIMEVDPVKLPKEQTAGNTEKWLFDSVAPALAKCIFLSPKGDIFNRFTEEVTSILKRMENTRQTVH
jgi:Replication initiation factor